MKIFVSQIYTEPRVSYPFSHHFQKFLSEELTSRVVPSDTFAQKYGRHFHLVFNVSAKADIIQPESKGPTVFKKDKDVEFTIFLTYNKRHSRGEEMYRAVLRQLLDEVVDVLKSLQIDVSQVIRDRDNIVERIVADPKMIARD